MKTMLMSFFVFLCTLLTAFAYTDFSENSFNDNVLEMSEFSQYTVREVLAAPEGKKLVPEGAILGVNDVTEINFTYEVLLDDGFDLTVTPKNITLKKGDDYYNLEDALNFNINIIYDEAYAYVDVSIRLNMPRNQEEYLLICGSTFTYDLLFTQIETI